MNQIVCQETDGSFCARDSPSILLNYYLPVSLVVFVLCQLNSYKQISYVAKLAMVATVVAICAIIVDSLIQIFVHFNIDYSDLGKFKALNVTYTLETINKEVNFMLPVYPFLFDCFCKVPANFEGAPFVPKLYTNAKNKHFFVRNLNRGVLALGFTQAIMGIVCVYAYGSRLQEIVLMNLYYGVFS